MKIVVPFGFYGWGNIGDEATLNGFARMLMKSGMSMRVSVGSRNPRHTARVEPSFRYFRPFGREPRRWLAKLGASAQAVVGGTPIMDVLGEWPLCELTPLVRSIDRWNVPLSFIGVGIEGLRLDESRRIVADEFVPRVRHWSVRSDRDRLRLIEYGASPQAITLAADMAWLIEPESGEFGRLQLRKWGVDPAQPLIGVNLVNENLVLDRQPQMVAALAAALDTLSSEMDARVVFLANEVRENLEFDRAAAIKVIQRMTRADRAVLAPNEYFAPREMMSIIDSLDLSLTMRYHFCLFSTLQNVPFIAIQRSDKVADLCWDMEWTANVIPPHFHADEIVLHARRMMQNESPVSEQLSCAVHRMADRAMRNVVALAALRGGNPVVPASASLSPGKV